MNIISTYSVAIKNYNRILKRTVQTYRKAVDFFINVANKEWNQFSGITEQNGCIAVMERLTNKTKDKTEVSYDFGKDFYKFPCYLRRAAIKDAVGLVSSYRSNLANWEALGETDGKPSLPSAGHSFPCMYKTNVYNRIDTYSAEIKIYNGKEWLWLPVNLKKGDVDYILHHCSERKEQSPSLVRRGKKWFLDFSFEENRELHNTNIWEQTIIAVDLGIKNACTCCVMKSDGAVHGRYFLKLPVETDQLNTDINRIKKAQQHGASHTPRKWTAANATNTDIARKTANFIIDVAVLYSADTIVFEHLNLSGKKRGGKKQKLHLWRAKEVQELVTHKAHRLGMRISRVCAWGTSRLAFDGSGSVQRGVYTQDGKVCYNYSICVFRTNKVYNCDLNASYNIGARYFIRELLKSLPEKERLALEAKVPSAAKRSTSTLSTLISLNAELMSLAA